MALAPAAYAQDFWSKRVMDHMVTDTVIGNLCAASRSRHERLPAACAGHPHPSAADTGHAGRGSAAGMPAASPTAMTFSPVAGDDAVRKLADSLGGSAQERAQILQVANAGKQMFEQNYAGNGWTNNIAGAMTYFIVATATVQTGTEADATAQERLFAALNSTLAQSDLARASNKDNTALYDTLLACAGLPLVFYLDGKQQGNANEVQQAKSMAATFSKKLFNVEPHVLAGLLLPGTVARTSGGRPAARAAAVAGAPGLDGRYDCQMLAVRAGASFSIEYRPIGLWFAIAGSDYSASGGGGRIDASPGVVGFHGGAYEGWRGARINDAIVFRKDDHANAQPGESIRNGDIRCGKRG
jgi:hypothetical protein